MAPDERRRRYNEIADLVSRLPEDQDTGQLRGLLTRMRDGLDEPDDLRALVVRIQERVTKLVNQHPLERLRRALDDWQMAFGSERRSAAAAHQARTIQEVQGNLRQAEGDEGGAV